MNFDQVSLATKPIKENIYNIPNLLTLLRVVIVFFIGYVIFFRFSIILVALLFIIGMLTDLFDGIIARTFNQKTEFGRNFDVIADRFLMIGTVFFLVAKFSYVNVVELKHISQIALILFREIISLPFVIFAFIKKLGIPQVRFIGKTTTFLQAVAFPAVILSISYPVFGFSIYLSVVAAMVGAIAALYYIKDIKVLYANQK